MLGLSRPQAPLSLETTVAVPRPTRIASPRTKGNIAFIVGHNHESQGAANYLGETEYRFNTHIALQAAEVYTKLFEQPAYIIFRPNGTYKEQVSHVVKECSRLGVVTALELHFNAYTSKAYGTEALVLDGCAGSTSLALELVAEISDHFGTSKRGIDGVKEVKKGHSGFRMLEGLRTINVTSAIIEPVFANFDTAEALNFFSRSNDYAILLARVMNKIANNRFK